MIIKPDARLAAAASLAAPGSVIADIGTDHAYLPVFLVQTGVCPAAIASDLRPGPLENAKKTVSACGLEDRIKLVLSDGLDALQNETFDTAVLCGMGGLLIAEILSRAAWIRRPGFRVIAQPMSHAEDVRRFFYETGFLIEREQCAEDGRHCYCAIAARFTGEKQPYSPGMPYFGALPKQTDPAARRYLNNQYKRLNKRFRALIACGKADDPQVRELEVVLRDFLEKGGIQDADRI